MNDFFTKNQTKLSEADQTKLLETDPTKLLEADKMRENKPKKKNSYVYTIEYSDKKKKLEDIYLIYGPSKLDYYKILLPNGKLKKMLIFGENHTEFPNCNEINCINFIDFMDIVTDSDKCIDFFIEQSPKENEGWNPNVKKGGGRLLLLELRKYALELQENKDNVRVQKFDLRTITNEDNLMIDDLAHSILDINDIKEDFLSNAVYDDHKIKFIKNPEIEEIIAKVKREEEIKIYYDELSKSGRRMSEEELKSKLDNKKIMEISNEILRSNYKNNIEKILNYLVIDETEDKFILSIINMMCLLNLSIFVRHRKKYFEVIKSKYKIIRNLNNNQYKLFLEIELKILNKIKLDTEIEGYANEINEKRNTRNDRDAEDQTLTFPSREYYIPFIKLREKLIALLSVDFLGDKAYLIADKELKEIIIKYFSDIITSKFDEKYYNLLIKGIENEIYFYKEIKIYKYKLKKSYLKFLDFFYKNDDSSLFENRIDIRQKIIQVMINKENFEIRFKTFVLNSSLGLTATLTDLYTFYRLFTNFDISKDRGPLKCRNVNTPEYIILYAGSAHTDFYKSIFTRFNILPEFSYKSEEKYVDVKNLRDLLSNFLE